MVANALIQQDFSQQDFSPPGVSVIIEVYAKSVLVSQVIAATAEAGLIKAENEATSSRKFARYIPFWA